MVKFRKVFLLPAVLDRKYSLKEKLSVWFGKESYVNQYGETRLKPYAIFRKFNKQGYCIINPYFIHNGKKYVHSMAEQRFYERGGFVFKSKEAERLYKEDIEEAKKHIKQLMLIRRLTK